VPDSTGPWRTGGNWGFHSQQNNTTIGFKYQNVKRGVKLSFYNLFASTLSHVVNMDMTFITKYKYYN